LHNNNNNNEDLEEKKVLGSGGYAFIYLTENEELKFNLGVPHLFFANIGRVDKNRFTKYYCNKCRKEYSGSPLIIYENPNEEIIKDVILLEKGEYKCIICKNTIAQYRKFNK
jgi:DNA-directed RNA polymerase subunit RPC12/RpoP